MRRCAIGWLCVSFLLASVAVQAAETLTVGGALMSIPDGWIRADADGRITLAPNDLPQGVVCTLTLLGGETFSGSVMDRLAADWKDVGSVGKVIWDDNGKLDGAGKPVEIASRAGTLEVNAGVEVHLWMVILHANGRIERMLLTTSTREVFAKSVPAVGALIQGTRFVAVKDVPAAEARGQPAGISGRMQYTVPRGWTEKRFANGAILSLEKPPAGEELELRLMAPASASGTLAQGLENAWEDACKQLGASKTNTINNTPYTTEASRKSFKGWEYTRATGIVTANANKREFFLELFVIHINDRFERLTVISLMRNCNVSRYSLYDSPIHRRTIQEFIFSLKFDDWKDEAVKPASLKGDGIIGVWQGISMFGGQFKAAYAIFYSNGQVFFGSRFPLAGCDQQNTWVEAEQTPRYWGTYTFENGTGIIKMPFGEIPIRSKGSDLVLTTNKTEHGFVRVPSVDGARFEGTYVMAEAYGKIPVITFTADGHFRDAGALVVLDHSVTNEFSIPQAPGAGMYSVQHHTITPRYSDERVFLLAYPGADYQKDNRSPRQLTLGFNEDTLKLK